MTEGQISYSQIHWQMLALQKRLEFRRTKWLGTRIPFSKHVTRKSKQEIQLNLIQSRHFQIQRSGPFFFLSSLWLPGKKRGKIFRTNPKMLFFIKSAVFSRPFFQLPLSKLSWPANQSLSGVSRLLTLTQATIVQQSRLIIHLPFVKTKTIL